MLVIIFKSVVLYLVCMVSFDRHAGQCPVREVKINLLGFETFFVKSQIFYIIFAC